MRKIVEISDQDSLGVAARRFEDDIVRAREISWNNFGRKILFYVPSFSHYRNRHYQSVSTSFPSISLTGNICGLKCSHCGGKILETMIPAQTPSQLIEACFAAKKRGALGCLISGGCHTDGSVPINRFLRDIAEIKKKLGLTIVMHTGLINLETAKKIKEAGIDTVSVDIIGSDETIREIYNLDVSTKDYEKTLEALHMSGIRFTPHVLVGIHYGTLKGELEALKMIAKYQPAAIVIIAFFPIKGTAMENTKPPSPESVISILVRARFMMPKVPLSLGCARPKGEHRVRTDALAVEAGVNALAFPSEEAIRKAQNLGLGMSFLPVCCSQVYATCR